MSSDTPTEYTFKTRVPEIGDVVKFDRPVGVASFLITGIKLEKFVGIPDWQLHVVSLTNNAKYVWMFSEYEQYWLVAEANNDPQTKRG